MAKQPSFIGALFRRWNKRPQRLDLSRMSERMRNDLGLPPAIAPYDISPGTNDRDINSPREVQRT